MLAKYAENELRNAFIVAGVGISIAVFSLIFIFSSDNALVFRQVGLLLANLWWLILPIPMWMTFYMVHSEYVGLIWVIKSKSILLEIKVPSDVEKSPKIMKQVIIGLHDYTTLSKFETYCGWRAGQNKYSFEIASIDGTVHFYIRCFARTRNAIEAQIYAHYPDAEVFEVPDYTELVPKYLPNAEWDTWGVTMKLVKDDAYPIRSFKYFKEDVTGKMIDPLASVIETMSNMTKGQHAWLQIIFYSVAEASYIPQAVKLLSEIMQLPDDKKKVLRKIYKLPDPEDQKKLPTKIKESISGALGTLVKSSLGIVEEKKKEEFDINKLTIPQQEVVKAIMENISDTAYFTTLRYVYVARKENWDKPLGVGGLLGALKQTSDTNFNAMRTDSDTKTYAQYYFIEPRLRYRQRKIVQNYKDRDFAGTGFVFTSEELATVFHFPDLSVKSPSVNRVEAKKGDAPANLPVEFE